MYSKLPSKEDSGAVAVAAEEANHSREWEGGLLQCLGRGDQHGWGACALSLWLPCVPFGLNAKKAFNKSALKWGLFFLAVILTFKVACMSAGMTQAVCDMEAMERDGIQPQPHHPPPRKLGHWNPHPHHWPLPWGAPHWKPHPPHPKPFDGPHHPKGVDWTALTGTQAQATVEAVVFEAETAGTTGLAEGSATVPEILAGVPNPMHSKDKHPEDIHPMDDEDFEPPPPPEFPLTCQQAVAFTGFTFILSVVMSFTLLFVAVKRRTEIREKFGIAGSRCGDFWAWWCCSPCALAQETRTLAVNNVEGGVWHGPTQFITQAYLAPKPAPAIGTEVQPDLPMPKEV